MVEYEANRWVGNRVPYYRDSAGGIRTFGDSKAEENSWNAVVLQLVTAMMPGHPVYRPWMYKNVELMC